MCSRTICGMARLASKRGRGGGGGKLAVTCNTWEALLLWCALRLQAFSNGCVLPHDLPVADPASNHATYCLCSLALIRVGPMVAAAKASPPAPCCFPWFAPPMLSYFTCTTCWQIVVCIAYCTCCCSDTCCMHVRCVAGMRSTMLHCCVCVRKLLLCSLSHFTSCFCILHILATAAASCTGCVNKSRGCSNVWGTARQDYASMLVAAHTYLCKRCCCCLFLL